MNEETTAKIGTLKEKTLHAVLKQHFETDVSRHEKKVGSFVADIATDSGIIEIQTRSFDKLRRKLAEFLEITPVTVVYPIPETKWLIWIDGQTGEVTKKRKSPKQGKIYDVIYELYKIKQQIAHQNFRLCLIFVDIEEYRHLDGWSRDKKKGSTRSDRIPVRIGREVHLSKPSDYSLFIPRELGERFTSKDYKSVAKINLRTAQTALNILAYIGVVARVGKQGSMHVYSRTDSINCYYKRP